MNVSVGTYILGISGSLLVLIITAELLRRRALRERHAAWWFAGGFIALLGAIFPQAVEWVAKRIGIEVPANMIFFVTIGMLFLILMQISRELTRLESKAQSSGEALALLELRVRQLEQSAGSAPTRSIPHAVDGMPLPDRE